MALTITEALAEIKTIGKRIAKKRDFMRQYVGRQDGLKDPLLKEGGSVEVLKKEAQAIRDLEERIVVLRRAIAHANAESELTVASRTRSIADWLTWRREVAPGRQEFLLAIRDGINRARRDAMAKGFGIVQATATVGDVQPTDILINYDERELADEIEKMEEVLGVLDGQLSLKNATITVDV